MTEQKRKLWDTINRIVVASGGDSACVSVARQYAVVAVESALAELVEATIRKRACDECRFFVIPHAQSGRRQCDCEQSASCGDPVPPDFGCIHWEAKP